MKSETPLEEWNPFPDPEYANRYEVSNLGRLRSLVYRSGNRRPEPLIRKCARIDTGHAVYTISTHGKSRTFVASRLVLLAFVGPPPEPDYEASHKDGDSHNDHLDNLVWESHADNERRKVAHGTHLYGEKISQSKLTDEKVVSFRQRLAAGERFTDLLRESGVTWGTFYPAMYGKTWKHLNDTISLTRVSTNAK